MRLSDDQWTIGHLRDHLQYAVSLEFWTIPFYMAAMLSIVDRTSGAFQLVQSIVNQEMLHLQLASNVANAYGLSPTFDPPVYAGQAIPHLNFAIDTPDPRPQFSPFSAEIGLLDIERVNAMCLIEFPEWDQGAKPDLRDDVVDYGSIGAFYDAVEYGASLLKRELEGGIRQVDHFGAFYRYLPALTVANRGETGFREAALLIAVIRDQGEGTAPNGIIRPVFQNTADDGTPGKDHYAKFISIREAPLPTTYPVKSPSTYTEHDEALLKALVGTFDEPP